MGVADRDWYREEPSRRRRLAPWFTVVGALGVVAVGAALAHGSPLVRPSADPEDVVHRDVSVGVGPGLEIPIQKAPLYARNDRWSRYLAGDASCPAAEDLDVPLPGQAATMICLINHARVVRGLSILPVASQLSRAARLKGQEIERCKNFAHAPCGGDAHDVAVRAGFRGTWGENLYIADGRYGAPRPALDAWLNSPVHRQILFRREWRVQSVYVVKLVRFPGFRSPTLWVSEFGA